MTRDIKETILSALELYKAKGVFFDEEQSAEEIDRAVAYINTLDIEEETLVVSDERKGTVKENRNIETHQLSIDDLLG